MIYSVYIHKAYFPSELTATRAGKEDFEQWTIQAASRADAAESIWRKNGERLLGLMRANATRLPRKVSLYVSDPRTGTGPGRLQPILVYKGDK